MKKEPVGTPQLIAHHLVGASLLLGHRDGRARSAGLAGTLRISGSVSVLVRGGKLGLRSRSD